MSTLEKRQFTLKLQMEILWWVVTAIIAFIVVYPMANNMIRYDFLFPNILFVLIFITYTRLIFLLKHTFLAYWQIAKFVLIFASIPLIFKLVEYIFLFQDFLEIEGLQNFEAYFDNTLDREERETILNYIRREYLFFGVGSVLSAIILPFRLLISFWRVYNKKGNV